MNGLTGFSFSWVQGLSKTAIKVLAGLHSLLETGVEKDLLSALSGYWQNICIYLCFWELQ